MSMRDILPDDGVADIPESVMGPPPPPPPPPIASGTTTDITLHMKGVLQDMAYDVCKSLIDAYDDKQIEVNLEKWHDRKKTMKAEWEKELNEKLGEAALKQEKQVGDTLREFEQRMLQEFKKLLDERPPSADPAKEPQKALAQDSVTTMNLQTINAAQLSLIDSLKLQVTVLQEKLKFVGAAEDDKVKREASKMSMRELVYESIRDVLREVRSGRGPADLTPKKGQSPARQEQHDGPTVEIDTDAATNTSRGTLRQTTVPTPITLGMAAKKLSLLGKRGATQQEEETQQEEDNSKRKKDDLTGTGARNDQGNIADDFKVLDDIKVEEDEDDVVLTEEHLKQLKNKRKRPSGSAPGSPRPMLLRDLQPNDTTSVNQAVLAAPQKQALIKKAIEFLAVKKKTNQSTALLQYLTKMDRLCVGNLNKPPGVESLFDCVHRLLPNLATSAADLRQKLVDFVGANAATFAKRWTQPELDRRGTTFLAYLGEFEKRTTAPDGISLVMLAAYLGKSVTLVSPDGYWSSDTNDPDIVLCYMGSGQFYRSKVDLGGEDCELDPEDIDALLPQNQTTTPPETDVPKRKPALRCVQLQREKNLSPVVSLNILTTAEIHDIPNVPQKQSEQREIGTVRFIDSEPSTSTGNYSCTEPGCNKVFNSRQGLVYHLETKHDKALTFKCDKCEETFSTKRECNKHQQLHADPNPPALHCNFCSYTSKHTYDVKRHQRTCPENPENKLKCTLCESPRLFQNEAKLKNHLQQVHKLVGKFMCAYCKSLFTSDAAKRQHKCSVRRRR